MNFKLKTALAASLLLTVVGSVLSADEGISDDRQTANLIFRNGAVYTVDAARSWASAVAVTGNRIVYVGTDAGVEPFIGPATRIVDLRGRMLLPGFQDSHLHPGSAGLSMDRVRVGGVFDREQVFRAIREYVEAHPERPWIEGIGWEEGAFKPSGLPTRQMLDEIVWDRPAFLYNSSHHDGWANSRALEIAGITAATPDPPNGVIERNASGEPTGIWHERAMGLVARHIPAPNQQERLAGYRRALREFARHGITAIIDAASSEQDERDYSLLASNGELNVRTLTCQRYSPLRDDEEQIREFVTRRQKHASGSPRATCIKIGLDGIIEQHTGALLKPYTDRPETRGTPHVESERLQQLVNHLDQEGFQIQIHAIADRAVRESLNAFEAARQANGSRDARHHLAHVQLIDPVDIPRLRSLGVTANMTPFWGKGDDWAAYYGPIRLGPERSRRVYQHRTIRRAGGRVAWGTDWSVTTLVPVEGLEVAVTRRHLGGIDASGEPDNAWLPEERLTLADAIASYTISGAYLSFAERKRGSIEVSKLADLLVLEQNLFEVSELEIHKVHIDMTLFDGRVIYERKTDG